MGLSSSSEYFQKRMTQLVDSIDGVICQTDDILVFGRTETEHDERLHKVLSRLNANLPNGVMKVVSNLLSLDNLVCQNPIFKSILLKYFAPERRPKLWSIAGNGKFSRLTLSLRRDRSMQILIFPLGFGTTTIPAHQSVGWSTRKITPVFFHVFKLLLHLRKQGNRDPTWN